MIAQIHPSGFGAEIWKRLGAEPVNLPGGEIATALREKKIDAGEWVDSYDDKLGLPAVARFYYYPAWWEPSAALSLYVNKAAYDVLPAPYKALITVATGWVNQWMMAAYDSRNPDVRIGNAAPDECSMKARVQHGIVPGNTTRTGTMIFCKLAFGEEHADRC